MVLTARVTVRRKYVPSFLGGLLRAGGTVCALVDGTGLDGVLVVTLALLLISTSPWRGRTEP